MPEQTIRAARASDRRKRRSIWRERPPAEREEERRSGNDALDALRDALLRSASVVADGFHGDPERVRHWMQLLYVNATVSQNGNVEGNNPRVLL